MRTGDLVLIIEDDADIREALSEILQSEGFAVVTAAHGLEALEYLRQRTAPSVIVTDLDMPKMDGWQFRKEQLADQTLRDIPTVIMSGTDINGLAPLSRLGPVEFVPKPIHLDTLLEVLRRLSQGTRQRCPADRRVG
jgi:CheY-like chemotaxis protein